MPKHFDSNFIKEVEEMMRKKVIEHLDKIAINAHNRLTSATPVDLGQARAGWNFTLNNISSKVPKAPIRKNPKNILSIPKSAPNSYARKIGDKYFLTNGVKHVKYLNEGSSQKAPTNFIEIEVHAAVKDIEGQK